MQSSLSPYDMLLFYRTITLLCTAFTFYMHACIVILFMYNTLLSLISASAFYVSYAMENWLFTLKGAFLLLFSSFLSIHISVMYVLCISVPFNYYAYDRMCILERVKVAKKLFSYRQVCVCWVSRLNILFCFN